MKRIRKLVIGGIESKVVTLVMVSMLLVAGLFLATMLSQNNLLTKLTQETSERQLASVTGTTAGVIHTVIEENMDRLTEEKAVATDRLFRDRALGVQLVADYAEKLLSDPDSVPRSLAEAGRLS